MKHRTHVFDMDGTLLVSNTLKSEAFRAAALPYGEEAADAMVALHQAAGTISRRDRVERFFADVLGLPDVAQLEVEDFLDRVEGALRASYEVSGYVPGAEAYLARLDAAQRRVEVVSGVEEVEARAILDQRGIRPFIGGIYGAPPNKDERLADLIEHGIIELPAVYYGDTEADYEAATASGMDFVLVTCDAEWDWRPWASRHSNVRVVEDFRELIPLAYSQPSVVRVERDGYAEVAGERRYFGRMLAGATVTVAPR